MLEKADELVELLLLQYLNGELSAQEAQRQKELTDQSRVYGIVYDELSKPGKIDELSKEYFRYIENFRPLETRKPKVSKGKLIRSKLFWRLSAAASVFLIVAIGAYFWVSDHRHSPEKSLTRSPIENPADLPPGQNKAILTLAGGEKVILDSAAIGKLTNQGNTIVLNQGSHLIYSGKGGSTNEVLYNTLTTAKGEIYSLVLSDNSRVWLNSASSIRFPVAFKGRERKVEISGEAYFEVVHNRLMPFKVLANGMEIEVLGTSYNVNCYQDEGSMKATLLEGIVRIKPAIGPKGLLWSNQQSAILKPGQQAQVKGADIRVINDVDLQQAVAWKNGYFQFERDDLQTVMRQIARWYDVEVVYEGEIPRREFQGKLHRNTNASEILKILEKSKIHFRIEGKKIIVTP